MVVSSANSSRLTKNFRIDCAMLLIANPTRAITTERPMYVPLDASVTPMPGKMKLAAAYAHVDIANTIVHQYAQAANQPAFAPVCWRVHW